jgi:hypothetical protein
MMSLILQRNDILFFTLVAQLGRLPIEYAALRDCWEEVEMLFPLTTRIPNAPVWSIEGVISHAKTQNKKPMVCYCLFLCCFYIVYCFKTKPLFFFSQICQFSLTESCFYYILLYA